jgi:hypothetical protein
MRLVKFKRNHVCPFEVPLADSGPYPKSPAALEDAQRTLGLVRFHAVNGI